ncbi:MAG: hypothetical protein MR006_02875 [Arcanobacterium sp.]|nr:hypothetical protein [Arcanobacterium sp.]
MKRKNPRFIVAAAHRARVLLRALNPRKQLIQLAHRRALNWLHVPNFPAPTAARWPYSGFNQRLAEPRTLRVAAILDEFSATGFGLECDMLAVAPDQWKSQLDAFCPDLFLCESAWAGADSEAHPWQGKIYARLTSPLENRRELLAIVRYCRRHRIPTVFWNKEDPTHFDDRARNFVATAKLFDHVFTTDINCVPRYEALGIHGVQVLQFAVQNQLYFPPASGTSRDPVVVFAGSWYHDLPERNAAMRAIFDTIIASPYELKIYDRHSQERHPNHIFPKEYQPYIYPAVTQSELAEIYRSSAFGLTINTVTDSATMYARRAYEILASGAVLLSNYSRGIATDFPDCAIFLDRDPAALERLTSADITQLSRRAVAAAAQHTYQRRFREIVAAVFPTFKP